MRRGEGDKAMRSIFQIIEEAGGLGSAKYISIINEPWMRLVIEVLPLLGTPVVVLRTVQVVVWSTV